MGHHQHHHVTSVKQSKGCLRYLVCLVFFLLFMETVRVDGQFNPLKKLFRPRFRPHRHRFAGPPMPVPMPSSSLLAPTQIWESNESGENNTSKYEPIKPSIRPRFPVKISRPAKNSTKIWTTMSPSGVQKKNKNVVGKNEPFASPSSFERFNSSKITDRQPPSQQKQQTKILIPPKSTNNNHTSLFNTGQKQGDDPVAKFTLSLMAAKNTKENQKGSIWTKNSVRNSGENKKNSSEKKSTSLEYSPPPPSRWRGNSHEKVKNHEKDFGTKNSSSSQEAGQNYKNYESTKSHNKDTSYELAHAKNSRESSTNGVPRDQGGVSSAEKLGSKWSSSSEKWRQSSENGDSKFGRHDRNSSNSAVYSPLQDVKDSLEAESIFRFRSKVKPPLPSPPTRDLHPPSKLLHYGPPPTNEGSKNNEGGGFKTFSINSNGPKNVQNSYNQHQQHHSGHHDNHPLLPPPPFFHQNEFHHDTNFKTDTTSYGVKPNIEIEQKPTTDDTAMPGGGTSILINLNFPPSGQQPNGESQQNHNIHIETSTLPPPSVNYAPIVQNSSPYQQHEQQQNQNGGGFQFQPSPINSNFPQNYENHHGPPQNNHHDTIGFQASHQPNQHQSPPPATNFGGNFNSQVQNPPKEVQHDVNLIHGNIEIVESVNLNFPQNTQQQQNHHVHDGTSFHQPGGPTSQVNSVTSQNVPNHNHHHSDNFQAGTINSNYHSNGIPSQNNFQNNNQVNFNQQLNVPINSNFPQTPQNNYQQKPLNNNQNGGPPQNHQNQHSNFAPNNQQNFPQNNQPNLNFIPNNQQNTNFFQNNQQNPPNNQANSNFPPNNQANSNFPQNNQANSNFPQNNPNFPPNNYHQPSPSVNNNLNVNGQTDSNFQNYQNNANHQQDGSQAFQQPSGGTNFQQNSNYPQTHQNGQQQQQQNNNFVPNFSQNQPPHQQTPHNYENNINGGTIQSQTNQVSNLQQFPSQNDYQQQQQNNNNFNPEPTAPISIASDFAENQNEVNNNYDEGSANENGSNFQEDNRQEPESSDLENGPAQNEVQKEDDSYDSLVPPGLASHNFYYDAPSLTTLADAPLTKLADSALASPSSSPGPLTVHYFHDPEFHEQFVDEIDEPLVNVVAPSIEANQDNEQKYSNSKENGGGSGGGGGSSNTGDDNTMAIHVYNFDEFVKNGATVTTPAPNPIPFPPPTIPYHSTPQPSFAQVTQAPPNFSYEFPRSTYAPPTFHSQSFGPSTTQVPPTFPNHFIGPSQAAPSFSTYNFIGPSQAPSSFSYKHQSFGPSSPAPPTFSNQHQSFGHSSPAPPSFSHNFIGPSKAPPSFSHQHHSFGPSSSPASPAFSYHHQSFGGPSSPAPPSFPSYQFSPSSTPAPHTFAYSNSHNSGFNPPPLTKFQASDAIPSSSSVVSSQQKNSQQYLNVIDQHLSSMTDWYKKENEKLEAARHAAAAAALSASAALNLDLTQLLSSSNAAYQTVTPSPTSYAASSSSHEAQVSSSSHSGNASGEKKEPLIRINLSKIVTGLGDMCSKLVGRFGTSVCPKSHI